MGFCYQKNFSNPTLPVDEAQFWALVRAEKWNENIDKYRETGDAALKRKLPAFIFQATFDETTSKAGKAGAWRKQSATQLTGLVVMDIDHVEKPREVFDQWGLGTDEHGFRVEFYSNRSAFRYGLNPACRNNLPAPRFPLYQSTSAAFQNEYLSPCPN